MTLDLSAGDSRCRLNSSIGIARAPDCCFTTSPPSSDLILLHTESMTVSEHARQEPASNAAQFRTLQPVSGTLARRDLHEWGQRTPHRYRWRVPGASRNRLQIVNNLKANFVAEDYGNSTLRIQAPPVGQRDRPSRV
jgi:hypothetical protein